MARAGLKKSEPVNVQLTIVRTELGEPDPTTGDGLLLEAPVPARTRKAPAAAPVAAAPAPTPAPAPRRTGLLVASALGGGVVIGGGAVGVAGVLAAALAGVAVL